MITTYKYVVVQILLVLGMAFGQFSNNITINTYNDDNLFRAPDSNIVQDILSIVKLGLSYGLPETNTQFYNNTNLILYKNTSDRNFIINNMGFSNILKIGEESNSNIYFGGNWSLRINKDDYNNYNYSQLSGYANMNILTDFILIKGGYSYRWRNYQNWTDLSNHLHNTFLQLNKSFPTRTTVIVTTSFGNKSFMGQDSFSTVSSTGRGQGRWGDESSNVITNVISEQLSTSQVNFVLRLTQSLHENVGIYFQYRKQISIDDSTNYRNFDDYYQDDELFDDPFTYQSNSYSSQLTLIMPRSTKLLIGGSFASKNYISELAYSTTEDTVGIGELRLDDQVNYFIDFSKTFNLNKDWINSIKFNLYFSHTYNESNSYWYKYKSTKLGGAIQWSF